VATIVEKYQELQQIFATSAGVEQKVYQEISRFVSMAFTQSMASDEGYCFKFTLPITGVLKLYDIIGFEKKEIYDAYRKDWGAGAMSNSMHSDPYYQILLLIVYYGLKEKKEHFYKNAMMCVLMKIWNGRKVRYIKYCDKKIMRYVTTHMVTKKHSVSKYDSPISLLHDYYVPTLTKKYGPEIVRNPIKLKRLFEQMFSRINQLFIFNPRKNLVTGKSEAQGGLLPLYMKAREQGMSISSQGISMGDDEPGFDQFSTVHIRDEMTNDVADYITMNPNPTYPQTLISRLREEHSVKMTTIEGILKSMHNHHYHPVLKDLISIMLSRTNVSDKIDVCKNEYYATVKRTIISSKNNPDTRKIQQLSDILLKKIFTNDLKDSEGKPLSKAFMTYSDVQKIQIRKVLIYGIVYNIRRVICRRQIRGL
jgi:hypothetical protein